MRRRALRGRGGTLPGRLVPLLRLPQACGAPFGASVIFPAEKVTFTGDEPGVYASSAHGRRRFCRSCGSPVFGRDEGSDEVELHLGSFDEGGLFAPHLRAVDDPPRALAADGTGHGSPLRAQPTRSASSEPERRSYRPPPACQPPRSAPPRPRPWASPRRSPRGQPRGGARRPRQPPAGPPRVHGQGERWVRPEIEDRPPFAITPSPGRVGEQGQRGVVRTGPGQGKRQRRFPDRRPDRGRCQAYTKKSSGTDGRPSANSSQSPPSRKPNVNTLSVSTRNRTSD